MMSRTTTLATARRAGSCRPLSCNAGPPPTRRISSTCPCRRAWRHRRPCASTTATCGATWPSSGPSTTGSSATPQPAGRRASRRQRATAWHSRARRAAGSAGRRKPGSPTDSRPACAAGACSARALRSARRGCRPSARRGSISTAGTAIRPRAGACSKRSSEPAARTCCAWAATCTATSPRNCGGWPTMPNRRSLRANSSARRCRAAAPRPAAGADARGPPRHPARAR